MRSYSEGGKFTHGTRPRPATAAGNDSTPRDTVSATMTSTVSYIQSIREGDLRKPHCLVCQYQTTIDMD